MNNDLKKTNNRKRLKAYLTVLGLLILSIVLCLLTVKAIKPLTYKEVEAILVSHDEPVGSDAERKPHCNGKFKYIVNGTEYDASLSIEYLYCENGHRRTIYYNANNPQEYAAQKSIMPAIVFGVIDVLVISVFVIGLINLFGHQKVSKKKSNSSDYKIRKLNNSIYGKYEVVYDVDSFSNRNGVSNMAHLSLLMKKTHLEHTDLEFEINLPKELLNTFLETDEMNNILDSYHELATDNFQNTKKEFINQDITDLIKWYKVSDSVDGKKCLIDKGSIHVNSIEIGKNARINKLYCNYNFEDNNSATFSFNYNITTKKIDDVDVIS